MAITCNCAMTNERETLSEISLVMTRTNKRLARWTYAGGLVDRLSTTLDDVRDQSATERRTIRQRPPSACDSSKYCLVRPLLDLVGVSRLWEARTRAFAAQAIAGIGLPSIGSGGRLRFKRGNAGHCVGANGGSRQDAPSVHGGRLRRREDREMFLSIFLRSFAAAWA